MSEFETLQLLPVNKTVVFYSPVEGKDVLVRTGTIGEGSCFYHALLHAYSKEYVSMDIKGRKKFVQRLRSSMARKVDKNRWESLSNGLIAKIPFQENINIILNDFYRFISRGKTGRTKSVRKVIREVIQDDNEDDIEAYKLVTEMVPLEEGFEKTILPTAYEKCSDDGISKCKKVILKVSLNYYRKEFKKLGDELEEERVNFYISKLEKLINSVVNEAENSSYSEYIESIQDATMEVDAYTIGLISEKFNRDIYFIDARNRMPYRDGGNDNIKKRKAIIVMWTGGCHYEIVGRLLPGNIIKREFDFNDTLIKKIYTYLYKPEKIPDQYPSLTSYLPKELRNELGIDISDSEEDRRSHQSSGLYESFEEFLSSDEHEKSSNYEKSDSEEEKFEKVFKKESYYENRYEQVTN